LNLEGLGTTLLWVAESVDINDVVTFRGSAAARFGDLRSCVALRCAAVQSIGRRYYLHPVDTEATEDLIPINPLTTSHSQ